MAFGNVEADYGEQGPEHFDRWGLRHYVTLRTRRTVRTFMDANLSAPIKRLGLTLRSWQRTWQGSAHYFLNIHGRPLEIRCYEDGRIKLFLDGEAVYTEDIKVVTRHGERYREVAVWRDPAPDTFESMEKAEAARQARLDAVRERLNQRRAGVISRDDREAHHDDPGEEDPGKSAPGQAGRTSKEDRASQGADGPDPTKEPPSAAGQGRGEEGRTVQGGSEDDDDQGRAGEEG